MHRLSMVQLLSIWSDLEAAYYLQNGFGTDTAEIYMYRLMPACPMAKHKGQYDVEQIADSSSALLHTLEYFAATRDARIWVNGKTLDEVRRVGGRAWESRVAVRVWPRHAREVVAGIAQALVPLIKDLKPEMRCELKEELFEGFCHACCGSNPNCPCERDE